MLLAQQPAILVVPTIENGGSVVFGWFNFSQFFVFHSKSGTANNHRTGLSDISYYSPFSRNSDDIKKLFPVSRKIAVGNF